MTSAAAVAAPSAVLQSHRQLVRQTREHLRVLPASANWYCSKVRRVYLSVVKIQPNNATFATIY